MELASEQRLRRERGLVLGDERRRGSTSKRVLDDLVILGRAEQDADRWPLVRFLDVAVESLDVEAQLADVLGLELAHFELEGDEAREAAVEEDEVDREVLLADLYGVLGADEAKVATELGDEATEVTQDGAVEVRFQYNPTSSLLTA